MTDQDDELLSQYLDGELGASDSQALGERLAAEPALQAQLERLQAVDSKLRSAFDVPEACAVPANISQLLQKPASNVVAFPQRRRAAWGFAVAASVLAASGMLFIDQSQQGSGTVMPGVHSLAEVLEQSPSRAEGWDQLADGSQARPILSFKSKSGDWCREFLLATDADHWRGVACRGDNGWNTKVLGAETGIESTDEYRPAGSGNVPEVTHFVDTQADDIALSASQEAQLIDHGWK